MGKNSKRIVSIVISALMLISLMSVFCIPTFAEDDGLPFADRFPDTAVDGADGVTLTKDAWLIVNPDKATTYQAGDHIPVTFGDTKYYFVFGTNAFAGDGGSHDTIGNTFKNKQVVVSEWCTKLKAMQIAIATNIFTPNFNTKPYIADGYGLNSKSHGDGWQENPAFFGDHEVVTDFIAIKTAASGNLGLYGFTVDGMINANHHTPSALKITIQNTVINQQNTSLGGYNGKSYIYNIFNMYEASIKAAETQPLDNNATCDNSFTIKDCYIKNVAVDAKDGGAKISLIGNYVYNHVTIDGLWIPEEVGATMKDKNSFIDNRNKNFSFTVKNSNIGGFMPDASGDRGMFYFKSDMTGLEIENRTLEFSNNILHNVQGRGSKTILFLSDASSFNKITYKDNYFEFDSGNEPVNFFFGGLNSKTDDNNRTVDITITGNVFNGMKGNYALGAKGVLISGTHTIDKNFYLNEAVEPTGLHTGGALPTAPNGTCTVNNGYLAYDFDTNEFSQYSADLDPATLKVGETTAEADEGDGKYKVTLKPGADEQITAAAYDTREGHVTVEVKQGESEKDTVDANACKAPVEYTITLTDTCNSSAKEYTLTVTREHNWAERVTQDPTCRTPGTKEHYCTVCQTVKAPDDDTTVEADPENGHKFTKTDDRSFVKTEGDCTNPTVYYKTCEYCGISAEGHDENATFEGEVVSDAHRWKDEHIPGNVHVTQAATCDKDGEGYVECELNPEHHKTVTIEKLNPDGQHTWKGWEDDAEKSGYEKDECTVCSATREREKPKIDSASLTLYDNIDVNFKVKKSALDGYTSDGYSSPYIEVELNGETTKIESFTQGEIKPVDSDTTPAYVFTFTDIAPQMMGDTLTAKLYATKGDEPVLLDSFEYSVKQYCTSMLEKTEASKEEYTEFRAMLVDMLNYGAAAQTYTSYNADSLVNADLGEAAGEGTQQAPEPENVFNISDGDNPSNIIRWLGAGLSISDTIALRFRVDLKDGETTEGLSVDVSGINTDNIKTEFVLDIESKNEYYLYIRGIETTQMNTALTIVVKKAGSNVSGTLTYSIANYAYEMKDSADENLKAFNSAMLKLGKSAKAYFDTIQ